MTVLKHLTEKADCFLSESCLVLAFDKKMRYSMFPKLLTIDINEIGTGKGYDRLELLIAHTK